MDLQRCSHAGYIEHRNEKYIKKKLSKEQKYIQVKEGKVGEFRKKILRISINNCL